MLIRRSFFLTFTILVIGSLTVWKLLIHSSNHADPRVTKPGGDGEWKCTWVSSKPNCSAQHNIVFFKTHKTAGSSIQNMMMRYGSSHNLTFVVPRYGNYFGHPTKFYAKMARSLKPGYQYNIFTHHSRFNRPEIASIMPSDTKYFTILRDPVDVFESAYTYYYLDIELNITLEAFATLEEGPEIQTARDRRAHKGKMGRNQMSFDLGLEVESFEDPDAISMFTKQLEEDFDFIMIAERLPESLILLKHILCWTNEDIVIFHHNSRRDKFKMSISPELKTGILHWHKADQYIYNHFSLILDKKIEDFGVDRMEAELKALYLATEKWYEFCVESAADNKQLIGKDKVWSDLVSGFKLKNKNDKTCRDLTKAELAFTEEIQARMRRYYLY